MKGRKTLITSLAIGAALFAAASSYAWMGGRAGHMGYGPMMMGPGMMGPGCDGPAMHGYAATRLTEEQRAQAQEIEEKYRQEFTSRQQAILDKQAELRKALADDTTTVADLNRLRDELRSLRQDLWTLRSTVAKEIAEATGVDTSAFMGPGWCWRVAGDPQATDTPAAGNRQGPGYGPRHMMWW